MITIGMPLYNNAGTVARALDALLSQTYPDILIVISDDASTDGTAEICEQYARRDSRVSLVRQRTNLNYGNFRYLLNVARTRYFMWAAGDDWWDRSYIEKNIRVLEADSTVVLSVTRTEFVKSGHSIGLARGTFPLAGPPEDNIARFLLTPFDNSRMYGVFRTRVARQSFPAVDFHAYDWALSALSLQYGKHFEIDEVLMKRDYTQPQSYTAMAIRDARGRFDRLFPLWRMTRYLLTNGRLPWSRKIVLALLDQNMDKHREVAAATGSILSSLMARPWRMYDTHVRWRLWNLINEAHHHEI